VDRDGFAYFEQRIVSVAGLLVGQRILQSTFKLAGRSLDTTSAYASLLLVKAESSVSGSIYNGFVNTLVWTEETEEDMVPGIWRADVR
jgi:hypothetical protein